MGLKEKYYEKLGKYCAVSYFETPVTVTIIPAGLARSDRDAIKYCENMKYGLAGKLDSVEDDHIGIEIIHSGYSIRRVFIPIQNSILLIAT